MNPSNHSEIPSPADGVLAGALYEIHKAREAMDRAVRCVEQAVKLAQLDPSPQPFCGFDLTEGRDVHLVAKAPEKPQPFCGIDFAAEDKLLYEETAKKAANKIEDAYAAAARELYGKTGTFVVPPDATKCRRNLVQDMMPAPVFCEVCGSSGIGCALASGSTAVPPRSTAVPPRSTADLCAETAKPVRIRPAAQKDTGGYLDDDGA